MRSRTAPLPRSPGLGRTRPAPRTTSGLRRTVHRPSRETCQGSRAWCEDMDLRALGSCCSLQWWSRCSVNTAHVFCGEPQALPGEGPGLCLPCTFLHKCYILSKWPPCFPTRLTPGNPCEMKSQHVLPVNLVAESSLSLSPLPVLPLGLPQVWLGCQMSSRWKPHSFLSLPQTFKTICGEGASEPVFRSCSREGSVRSAQTLVLPRGARSPSL